MEKWTGRYLMTAAVFLQTCAAFGFGLAEESDGLSVIFAIPLAIVSLGLYGRGSRLASQKEEVPPEASAPPPRLEEMILNLQEDVNRLREDREFYRDLYLTEGEESDLDGGVERAPVRNRALTYRLVPERSPSTRPPSGPR